MPPKAAAKRRDIPLPVEPVLPRTRSTQSAARKDNVNVVASQDDEDAHDDQNTRTDNVAPQGNNSRPGRNTRLTTCKDATSDKVTVAVKASSKKTAEASRMTDIPISKRGPPWGVNPDAEHARHKGGMSDRVEVPLTRYGDKAVDEQDHDDNDAPPVNHEDAAANPAGGSDDGTLRSSGDFTNNGDRAVEEHDCLHEDNNDTSPGNCSNNNVVAAKIGGLVDSIFHRKEVDEGEGEGDDSSGDDDRSNYSADETTRHRKKQKCRSHGKSVSDTDEEDLEADKMMDDVVPELGAWKSGKCFTGKQKGKKRAVDKEKGVNSNDDEANDQEDVPKGCHTPGPLSAKARAEAQALGDHVQNRARALADKYNKPYGSIMLAAGLTIQKARHGQNFSN